ncbi:MAG: DUF4334 domain-containing protein [bacterium]|nr:DUF4334 domain-containing protein [bacterium]
MHDLTIKMDNFKHIMDESGALSCKKLDQLFKDLQPITIEEMAGEWEVGFLFTEGTGSKFETFLRYLPNFNIHKIFLSKNSVKAIVLSLLGFKISIPATTAILEVINYRNKVSPAMIYNYLPMIDYFRKVDDQTVMGIMEIKGKTSVYFYLKKTKI